jgi:hypothetical protein
LFLTAIGSFSSFCSLLSSVFSFSFNALFLANFLQHYVIMDINAEGQTHGR